MRECVGGGAFAEMIIGALFGYTPQIGRPIRLLSPAADRGFEGKLLHVRHGTKLLRLHSGPNGVRASTDVR